MNDNGDAVGVFGADNSPTEHAFLWSGLSVVDLVPTLPLGSLAAGINNSKVIVGSFGIGDAERGFVYDSATQAAPVIIDPLPGKNISGARAVNQSGAVVGVVGGTQVTDSSSHAEISSILAPLLSLKTSTISAWSSGQSASRSQPISMQPPATVASRTPA